MDNVLKGIVIGAGVLITCIVIGVGFRVYRETKTISSTSAEKLERFSSELSENDLTMYDGLEVTGSDVVNFIKKHLSEYSSSEVAPIYVNIVTSTTLNDYVNGASIPDIVNFTTDKYISPISKYNGKIVRDKNNVIVGLIFTKK